MDTKIFLQGHDSKKSSNTSEGLNVQFKGKRRLLPLNDVAKVVSQYDQYTEEREKCNKIRLTCQVNPICSNVLFNRISEIVHNEGSSAVTFVNYSLNPSGDSKTFENVVYKKKTMDFWNSGNMNYQSLDTYVNNLSPKTRLFEITDTTHYTNGEITSNLPHPTNAIRDTQLSKSNIGFVYHCGLDFLNNHLVRSNTFKIVCKCPKKDMGDYTAFNTIADLMRTVKGDKVVEKLYYPITETSLEKNEYLKMLSLHLYEYDDILSYEQTVKERLIAKYNGWVGFYNRPKMKSYSAFSQSDLSLDIERPLSYMNSGDFIDMYPGRDLYSFIPKYNTHQKRIEKNWNYCITYPSSSYTPTSSTSAFSDIFETNDGLNSLKTIYFNENTRADNGTTQLVMYSISKHGLAKGDYVNIYKTYTSYRYWVVDGDGVRISDYFDTQSEADNEYERLLSESQFSYNCGSAVQVIPVGTAKTTTEESVNRKILDNAEVSEVVDDYIFVVFGSTVQISNKWVLLRDSEKKGGATVTLDGETYQNSEGKYFIKVSDPKKRYYIVNNEYVNFDDNAQDISYKKTYGDIECEYYVRIFSKVPNFKFASGDTSSEYEIYRRRENGESMIATYQSHEYEFENHISRLAFAKNIYADEIGEIVFTDDIDLSNIHDNLGRPLTSLYLTLIKNNKGYKEWYGWKNQMDEGWDVSKINSEYENIEYSHCFGPVTCGIRTSDESINDNSIANIVRINNIDDNVGYNLQELNGSGRTYLSSSSRNVNIDDWEVWYETDKHFFGDLCYYDAYNAVERHIQYVNHRFSSAQRELDQAKSKEHFEKYAYDEIVADDYDAVDNQPGMQYIISSSTVDHCNQFREGYYYIPHYEIPIKTFDKLQSVYPDFLTIREFTKIEGDGVNIYRFTTLQQHFLGIGDKAVLYDTLQNKYYNLIAISGNNDNYRVFTCKVYEESNDGREANITYAVESNGSVEYKILNHLSTSATMESVSISDFKLFKMDNLNVPSYARILKDGTCRVIWRDVLNNGFNKSDDSVEEYPFTNGAFYVNKKIDLHVRRQDPYNEYGLYDESDIKGNVTDLTNEDNYIKESDIEC